MKPIKDFEGLYSVDKKGNVFSHRSNRYIKPFLNYKIGTNANRLVVLLSNKNKSKKIKLHRLIAETFIPNPENLPIVDHIDRNPLNNNIKNLRWCNQIDNKRNRGNNIKKVSSKYKGVYWSKQNKKWVAYMCINGRTRSLGRFNSEIEAAEQYNIYAKQIWQDFAVLNIFHQ